MGEIYHIVIVLEFQLIQLNGVQLKENIEKNNRLIQLMR